MIGRHVALALALVAVTATIGVGAATPPASPNPTPVEGQPGTMGSAISSFMSASAAQTDGSVENGMWVAAYENASDNATRRELVEARVGALDTSVQGLQTERSQLLAAYRKGSINETEYRARLGAIAGQLAALGEGIEATGKRGKAVGVNATRLEKLRSQAHELGGGAVSAIARNLTGDRAPPGQSGIFGDGPSRGPPASPGGPPTDKPSGSKGGAGDRGRQSDRGGGPPAGNATATGAPSATRVTTSLRISLHSTATASN